MRTTRKEKEEEKGKEKGKEKEGGEDEDEDEGKRAEPVDENTTSDCTCGMMIRVS